MILKPDPCSPGMGAGITQFLPHLEQVGIGDLVRINQHLYRNIIAGGNITQ